MSEFDYEDDDFDVEDAPRENTVLRDLRKANKAKERQIRELSDQLSTLQRSVRERSIKDTLANKGLNVKIAAFIPETLTTSDEVEGWINEYADVFGGAPSEVSDDAEPSPELQALGRIAAVQQSGQSYSGDADQLSALIASAKNPEDLNKLLFGSTAGPNVV